MDARLTTEQKELREAAARLAGELGPGSVLDLDDADRVVRLEKAVAATGWRSLRTDGASGVEVAIIAEEFGRGLVDVPFLGPVLADDLRAAAAGDGGGPDGGGVCTIAVAEATAEATADATAGVAGDATVGVAVDAMAAVAVDARGVQRALILRGNRVLAGRTGETMPGADLTRRNAALAGPLEPVGEPTPERAERWRALALVATCADLLGAARGAHTLACDHAKVREQYGRTIGSYQAVAHLLAEGLALIEGSVSVLRHAAWAVDELSPAEATRAAQVAKLYCARAARTICETAVQVHGGIGNTWECLAHVYLRRVLTATELFPVALEEIDLGLS